MRVAIGRERETLDRGDRAKGGPRDLNRHGSFSLSHGNMFTIERTNKFDKSIRTANRTIQFESRESIQSIQIMYSLTFLANLFFTH